MDYVTTQITELLTNYGPIPILVIDGWSWKMGHKAVPYERDPRAGEVAAAQLPAHRPHPPERSRGTSTSPNFEEPQGAFAPANNTYAANQEQKINASGGNDWFWAPNIGGLMSVDRDRRQPPARCSSRAGRTSCSTVRPTATGLMDAAIVTRLGEVGAAWSPNASRPTLPAQGAQIEYPYTPTTATATSGTAPARSTASTTTTTTRSGDRRARCRSRSRSISAQQARRRHARLRARVRGQRRAPTERRDHVVRDPGQHQRHDLHGGDVGHLGGRRQDEGRDVRPGRRALRPPGGPRRQRRQRARRPPRSRSARASRSRASAMRFDVAPAGARATAGSRSCSRCRCASSENVSRPALSTRIDTGRTPQAPWRKPPAPSDCAEEVLRLGRAVRAHLQPDDHAADLADLAVPRAVRRRRTGCPTSPPGSRRPVLDDVERRQVRAQRERGRDDDARVLALRLGEPPG